MFEKKNSAEVFATFQPPEKEWISKDSLIEWCNKRPYCNVRKLLLKEIEK